MKVSLLSIGILTLSLLVTGLAAQENKNASPASLTATDIDGNVYKTVTIGTQVWMAENLKTTKYRNGDVIGTTSPATLDISSESSPKYQWAYAGNKSNVATYGRLYTWYAATDSRNVCPTGWHVPSDAEWTILGNLLGGKSIAIDKSKHAGTMYWKIPNAGETNESGFLALSAGSRWPAGEFEQIGKFGHYWAANEEAPDSAWRMLNNYEGRSALHLGSASPKIGWPVRCLRDASALPSAGLAAQENKSTTPANVPQPQPSANYLELQGTALGEISGNSASLMNFHVSNYLDRVGKSGQVIPEQAMALKAAGKAALDANDYYRAYRLQARALGWTHGENKVEHYEVAASLTLALNRAIFSGDENITLTLRPLFTLGHPLANHYTAQSWLETQSGVIPGTEQKLTVTELKEFHFDHPVKPLQDGVIAVCYRLVSPTGETLAELKHAVVVAKDLQTRLDRMKAKVAAVKKHNATDRSPAFVSALDTADYNIRSLEQERAKFDDGNWRRSALPLGMYLIQLNWTAIGRPVDSFPQFNARLRYPQDVDFAESLITALAADPDALLKLPGDMVLASISTKNDELLRYRIFVPRGYDRTKKYSLIVALHSGGGDGEFFEFEKLFPGTSGQENGFKRLAQERGYILVCPNGGQAGFFGERGEADILNIVERVRNVYSIDPNRVFLTGWSGGSEVSWRIAMKYPEHFAAAAPVGVNTEIAKLLNQQNVERALDLPVLYSVPGTEVEQGRIISASAKALLRNFTYREYPDAEHADVWLKALPALFDFFDAHTAGAGPTVPPPTAPASMNLSGPYLGQTPPGATPQVFAPGLISKNGLLDGGPYFTPDGNEVIWRENLPPGPDKGWVFRAWTMRRQNGVWSAPYPPPFAGTGTVMFSPDGQRVYFSPFRSGAPDDIWFADRQGDGWSEPKCLSFVSRWPELKYAYVNSIARNGNLYFVAYAPGLFDNSGIYRAELVNGEYTKPKLLPSNINLPPFLNWTPFIAPDESYLLFSSTRTGSHGLADLFISFRNTDGSWTDPVGLGEAINTEEQERYPVVSPDGKYLFFTRGDGAVHNVYWVSASVLEPLRLQARGWTNLTGDYLGQKPPGATPQVFARGIVSTDDKEHSTPAFSPDGDEVFWREARPPGPNNSEWLAWGITMRRENGHWSAPRLSPYPNISVFSVDGKRQYFGAPRPGATHEDPPLDIWVTERQGDGWSAPKCLNLISQSPELQIAAWPTVARNGNLYFISSVPEVQEQRNKVGIARAQFANGQYAKPELLPKNINMAPYRNWAPFIAPDESYLIFSSTRPGSLDDEGDLYISRPLADGKWTDPVRLGAPINTEYQERFSGLSPDGKYFFFTRWSPEHDEDVYWVDAATIPELRSIANLPKENSK